MAASFTHVVAGRDVTFDASASTLTGTIVDWKWEFGDGDESTGETSDHTYLGQVQSFNVTLTVFDDAGNSDNVVIEVTPAVAFYCAPNGTSAGVGTLADPIDLAALCAGTANQGMGPATFWLRGGTYDVGEMPCFGEGAEGNPCIFRGVPGEAPVIDGHVVLTGQYQEWRDVEVMSSAPAAEGGDGVSCRTPGLRLVNLIVHDAGVNGIGYWIESTAGLVTGCVVYNNGANDVGHGFYVQNDTPVKAIAENIIFNNLKYGIQVYGGSLETTNNITISGNVGFNNSVIHATVQREDFFSGAVDPTDNLIVTENYSYRSDGERTVLLGWDEGSAANGDLTVTDNYWVGNADYQFWATITDTGNTVEQIAAPPGANVVTVRANPHVHGYGHVICYNWTAAATVTADPSTILRRGDSYAVYEAQGILGSAVLTGTWDGVSSLTLPMDEVVAPVPIGRAAPTPPTTGTQFHAFVVRRTGQSYIEPAEVGTGAGLAPYRRRRR